MAITINGTGSITGISAGGLPDGSVTATDLASSLDLTGKTVTLPSGVGGKFESYAVVTDRKASGTSGGSSVSATWSTRELNHELFDPDGIVSLSSNQFTLAAGTYCVEWAVPLHDPGWAQTRLYNATDATSVQDGQGTYSNSTLDLHAWLRGVARFTITAPKAFELQYKIYISEASYGLGIANGYGAYEYYATAQIFKEA